MCIVPQDDDRGVNEAIKIESPLGECPPDTHERHRGDVSKESGTVLRKRPVDQACLSVDD